jgi:ubiquinone/menaquinone biosynthesis C-methylase UbiE
MTDEKERIDRVFKDREPLAGRYSLDIPGNRINFENLRGRIEESLRSRFDHLSSIKMLDLGSGDLFWPDQLIDMGLKRENCIATDLLFWRLADGRAKGRMIDAVASSGDRLPFAANCFDIVCQFTMMTSVLNPRTREMIAEEMTRVLRPGGYILWYDFRYNNPANKNTRAIGKQELGKLFADLEITLETVTVVPQLARKIGRGLSPLLKFAERFSILRTHYLALIGPKG